MWYALALAQEPAAVEDALAPEATGPSWEVKVAEAGSYDVLGVIDQAIDRRLEGDLPGARTLLIAVEAELGDAQRPWWLYQRGITEELDHDPDEARGFYEAAIALFEAGGKSPGTAADARFRLALVLEDLGRPEEALAQMKILGALRGLSEDDRTTVALQTAISKVWADGRPRDVRSLGAMLDDLDRADPVEHVGDSGHAYGWLRGKGRYALADHLLAEAADVALTGGERRVVRLLERRARLVQAAEAQILGAMRVKEPEWILHSLLALGDAYLGFGEALAAAPVPARLQGGEILVYQEGVGKLVSNAKDKAWHWYDQGVALATRLRFESPLVPVLVQRRAQLGG